MEAHTDAAPQSAPCRPTIPAKTFRSHAIGYFHIDIAEVQTAEGKLYP